MFDFHPGTEVPKIDARCSATRSISGLQVLLQVSTPLTSLRWHNTDPDTYDHAQRLVVIDTHTKIRMRSIGKEREIERDKIIDAHNQSPRQCFSSHVSIRSEYQMTGVK
jgi:hypothetical protein